MKKNKAIAAIVIAVGLAMSVFAAQQVINVGTTPDDGTGDTLRAAFVKTNANFTELYTQAFDADLVDLADGSLTGSKVGSGIDAANITTGTVDNARLDTDLQTLAGITYSANVQTFLGSADVAAMRTNSQFPVCIIIPLSPEDGTDITTGTDKFGFHIPFAMTVTEIKLSCNEGDEPTGDDIDCDLNEEGTTIITGGVVTIAASANTGNTTSIADASIAEDAYLTADVITVGSTNAGSNLKMSIIGYRTGAL